MSNIKIIKGNGRELSIDREIVFKQIKCDEDNPMYEEFNEEYEELLPEVLAALEPAAALVFAPYPQGIGGSIKPGTEVLYMITTVGKKICDIVSDYFKSGDYVKGMLSDAMASAALFSFEKPVFKAIYEMCGEKHVGIRKRYEAPGHVPMEIQKVAYDALNAGETLGLTISSGFMYDPVKSSCQVFETTDNERVMRLTHGCADCSNTDCPHRMESVSVRVSNPEGDYEFSAAPGTLLSDILIDNNIKMNLLCGGSGRCGKCAVKVLEGSLPVTDADKKFFSDKELSDGMRLSCRALVNEDILIELTQADESSMVSLSAEVSRENKDTNASLGIAIDIGTTTLAFSLINKETGDIIDTYTSINSQRKYGADVITRIEAAGKGLDKELKSLIEEDLITGINTLLDKIPDSKKRLQMLCIAGNTTMLHLLMGYPAESLGVYPFTPHSISLEKRKLNEVLSNCGNVPDDIENTETILIPGNSAYVGADIISGLYSCGFHENDKICALIDLGTNGEMAVGNKDKLYVTSTAAGPAFEGGNIKYGVGGIRGAISSVEINGDKTTIKTIGDSEDVTGICGTGVIEVTAELLKAELLDETGVLDDDYFDDGFPLAVKKDGETIVFTEKDIREIQLAKSAIRAGFETMLKRYGAGYDDIDKLYIAGGFGYFLNAEKAAAIGMIPEELLSKCVAAGNKSLSGAIKTITEGEKAFDTLTELAEKGEEIALSTDKDFNEFYMEYMMFE